MRREAAPSRGAYAHVTALKRRTVERYGHLPGAPFRRQLADLEAVRPLDVPAWQLPGVPEHYGLNPWDRVVVHADDHIDVVARWAERWPPSPARRPSSTE